MSLNKTPGSDGLRVEFYKVFWSDISDHLLNALNYAYHKGQLSVSQKRGNNKVKTQKRCRALLCKKLATDNPFEL